VNAVIAGDTEAAIAAMAVHIDNAREHLYDSVQPTATGGDLQSR
jgi:DNA-binding GntR family transcriptional regulator